MARAMRSTLARSDYAADDAFVQDHHLDIMPGERIGRPLPSRRGRLKRRTFVLLVLIGCGWLYYAHARGELPVWLSATLTSTSASIDAARKSLLASPTRPDQAPQTEPAQPQLTDLDVKPAPIAMQQAAVSPSDSSGGGQIPAGLPAPMNSPAVEPVQPSATTASSPPSPAPTNPTDDTAAPSASTRAAPGGPYRKQAEAAGLHPGLSHVLLARLSPADYRNAGLAIRTALTETDDDAVYVWPAKPRAGLARFRIHFVPGAAPGCRRYVVTIAKDGWLTTALPMVKCGMRRTASRKG